MNNLRSSFRPWPLLISMMLVMALYYGLNQFDSRAIYASWDKWLHGAVFFLIWWLALWSLRWSALWVSVLVIAAGGAEEIHQLWQEEHMPDLKDWYADAVGVALAAAIYSLGHGLWAMRQSVAERESMPELPLRQDPFVRNLLARLPEQSRDTFSDEQLQALKLALGGRNWSRHLVDWRWTLEFWRWHYYFVFLAGHNRRALSHREQLVARWSVLLLFLVFLLASATIVALVLLLIKTALGIDFLPESKTGVDLLIQP